MGNPIMAIDPMGMTGYLIWIIVNMSGMTTSPRAFLVQMTEMYFWTYWTEENKSSIYKKTGLIPGDYGENWGAMYNLIMESEISIFNVIE